MLHWIEIAVDYRCNNRCVGCFAASDDGPEMSERDIYRHLRSAREKGAEGFWFGGGEPTTRPNFLKIVRSAKKLGFKRIKVQTNGMLCASEANLDRMLRAGVTEFNLSIKGATEEMHDQLAQTAGSFSLLCKAIDLMCAKSVPMEGDILMYQENTPYLREIIEVFGKKGVSHFNLWHLSLFGATPQQSQELAPQVPKMSDVANSLLKLRAHSTTGGTPTVTALHLPPCTLPRKHWDKLFRAAHLGLVVADPGGSTFRLEESPFEGGTFLERCTQCSARAICDGLREDYLQIHGDGEFQPATGASIDRLPAVAEGEA